MSLNTSWDVNKYKEDHECEEHWLLRKAFIEKWKNHYTEERLICLARVFANIEFLGCRYPLEVMREVARLSQDIAQQYRRSKRTKLARTFVSASDAATDRAKNIKREGGIIKEGPSPKSTKISFVPQGHIKKNEIIDTECENIEQKKEKLSSESLDPNEYMNDMVKLKLLDSRCFKEDMFHTEYGRIVLLIRPWNSKLCNVILSCQVCHVELKSRFHNNVCSIYINNKLIAEASGSSKGESKNTAGILAFNILRTKVISLIIKERWVLQGDRISMNDVSKQKYEFGAPVENNVAMKMMKIMGWQGGGLGADAQGIAEPIKPHLQMVNRAGLGSNTSSIHLLKKAGQELMNRFLLSDTVDVDLVFSSEFSKEERALLHQCAQRLGLSSKSYGDVDRFLVVTKRLDPFSLVRGVLKKGGNTLKHQVFLPEALANSR